MNVLDAHITGIVGKPYQRYSHWFQKVKYNCYGHESNGTIMRKTKEGCEKVKVGDVIQV